MPIRSDSVGGLSYWLAIVGKENAKPLADRGFPFYAVNTRWWNTVKKMNVGDGVLLYESGRGIIGVFEVSGAPYESNERVFPGFRTYPVRIPLKVITLLVEHPLSLRPLMGKLQFLPASANIGSYLQTTLRQVAEVDFKMIAKLSRSRQGEGLAK